MTEQMNRTMLDAKIGTNGVHLVPLDDTPEQMSDESSSTAIDSRSNAIPSRNSHQGNHNNNVDVDEYPIELPIKQQQQRRRHLYCGDTSFVVDGGIDNDSNHSNNSSILTSVAILAETQQFVNQIGIDWVSKEVTAVKKRYRTFVKSSSSSSSSSERGLLPQDNDNDDDDDDSLDNTVSVKRQRTIGNDYVCTPIVKVSTTRSISNSSLDDTNKNDCGYTTKDKVHVATTTAATTTRTTTEEPVVDSETVQQQLQTDNRKIQLLEEVEEHQQEQQEQQQYYNYHHREMERIAIMDQATRMRRISLSFRQLKSVYSNIMNELLSMVPTEELEEYYH
jgi:hypothetical protein